MSSINTNVSSLIAQRNLLVAQSHEDTSLERLSTGLKINSGADDPAGLIASENLKNQQAGLQQAIDNAGQAGNMIGTAEGGLNEVSNLLTQLTSLVNQSANTGALSTAQIAANQLQVDSILSTINRISDSTTFQGSQLLNGNLSYTTSGATSAFNDLQVNAAALPNNAAQNVVVQVTSSATQGQVIYNAAAENTAATPVGVITASAVTLEISGNTGTQQLSFAGSSTISSIAAAVNNVTATTGVTASAVGEKLVFSASNYGSSQYVSVKSISGAFALATGNKVAGTNATVIVNGSQAQTQGLDVSYNAQGLDMNFQLTSGGYAGLATGTNGLNQNETKNFYITGGGANFQLGAVVNQTNQASIGIEDVSTGSLGSSTLGYLSSLGSGGANSLSAASLNNAQKILTAAVSQVAQLRGRLGAFQDYTINSTVNSLNVAYENASSAESAIADTNFASETANLTRSQILQQSATSVLSTANSAPQSVLNLLPH
jgi:flagellin